MMALELDAAIFLEIQCHCCCRWDKALAQLLALFPPLVMMLLLLYYEV
jgi:hypothetical protein